MAQPNHTPRLAHTEEALTIVSHYEGTLASLSDSDLNNPLRT